MQLSDDEGENMTEHIVGTYIDDLTQIYNGRVLIKGSVDIFNIYTSNDKESSDTRILINGVHTDLLHINLEYWMKKLNQVI